MSKLQPNFSWQKYEGKPEDQKEQFQYQLMAEHILVANAINTTVDDLSFWMRERPTSFTWVTGQQLYTQTYVTSAWTSAGTINTIPLNLTPGPNGKLQIVYISCVLSSGLFTSSITLPVPYLDVTTPANSIQLQRVGENIILTSGGTSYLNYAGFVTIYYVKS